MSNDDVAGRADEVRVAIGCDVDIVLACQKGRELASQEGLSSNEQMCVVIAISEVARNIIRYAQRGTIVLGHARRDALRGVFVIACDDGPGIPDLAALRDGYSTGGGLGLGLAGARRLMDEFEIVSQVGRGTTVSMRKWNGRERTPVAQRK